ncbi:glutamate racemase [Massilia sp. TSP1-1-2]|uniref:glutamate racemase n=1 Tax=Massilia sp. TSP1-1-2 TaxID=2804649 RepID=UPI003CF91703
MTSASPLLDAPIGVFDSGVGGMSVLRHIQAQLPHENLIYLADTGYAPYGAKPEHVVAERSLAIAQFLVGQGAKALVVACNTATVAAIKLLRAYYPNLPLVGVEPGLKPAAAASRNGQVAVLATDVTLAGAKFLLLRDQVSNASGAKFLLQGCPGLVDQIELGECDSGATRVMLEGYLLPLLAKGVDTVVLGCTHYPFVRASIESILAKAGRHDVVLIDTGDAVARQLARLLASNACLRPESGTPATLKAFTTASGTALSAAFSSLLGLVPVVKELRIEKDLAIPDAH